VLAPALLRLGFLFAPRTASNDKFIKVRLVMYIYIKLNQQRHTRERYIRKVPTGFQQQIWDLPIILRHVFAITTGYIEGNQ
jgi:hypothetical protein